MIDNEDFKILNEIIFRKERSLSKLEDNYGMTRRQIIYTLEKINAVLSDNKLEKISISGSFILIDDTSNKFLEIYLINSEMFIDIYPSKEFRQMMLSLVLLSSTEYLSLDHLIILLMSSKSTVVNDLKVVRRLFNKKDFTLSYSRSEGYFLEGNEEELRYLLMEKVIYFLNQDNGEMFLRNFVDRYLETSYDAFESKIKLLAISQGITFFNSTLKEFTFSFLLLQQRLKRKKLSRSYTIETWEQNSSEFYFSRELCISQDIEQLENHIYITAWVLGLSVGDMDKQTFDKETISNIVQRLVARFENLAGIRFLNKESVIKRLYEHLRPSYYRLLFHLPIVNPLVDRIKTEYAEMYQLVSEAIEPLKPLFNCCLPEAEVAYLTVHFAASTFEEREEKVKRNRAIVLCPHGIGTSIILLKELGSLFPNIEFINKDLHQELDLSSFDLIFATTITSEILASGVPFIITNPILNPKEKYELIGKVYGILSDEILIDPFIKDILTIIERYVSKNQLVKIETEIMYLVSNKQSRVILNEGGESPLLSEITDPTLIKLNVEATNWEEAIRKSTDVLVENRKVMPSYIDGMIETTKEAGPYIVITKHVAMPHARPEAGAKEIAISIATLREPVVFGNKENDPVKYIFGLSALDNQTHLNAMVELVDLLDRPEFYKILDQADSPQEVFDYIKWVESEGKDNG